MATDEPEIDAIIARLGADPRRLFNSSLGGNAICAVDIHERDQIDGEAFKTVSRAAVEFNARR